MTKNNNYVGSITLSNDHLKEALCRYLRQGPYSYDLNYVELKNSNPGNIEVLMYKDIDKDDKQLEFTFYEG